MKNKRLATVIGITTAVLAVILVGVLMLASNNGIEAQTPGYRLAPVPVNDELCQRAATMGFVEAPDPEPHFSFSNSSDLAAIAMGRIQAHHLLDEGSPLRDGFIDALPIEPLFVESYDQNLHDYYLVPFVRNGKLTGLVKLTLINGKVRYGMAGNYVDNVTQPLRVMKEQAVAIVRQERQLESVPSPRLIYKNCAEMHGPTEPAWEFDLGGKKVYVNQEGKVFTAFTRPEKLGG